MTVTLKGQNGNEVEFGFLRDSYPEVQDGIGDSSWTTVNLRAATRDDTWEETAPCINLFEFQNLAEWLEAVGGQAAGESPEIELLGPELRFSAPSQNEHGVTIRVHFHLSQRPEVYGVDADTDAEYVDVFMPREAILAAAGALRRTLGEVTDARLKDDLEGETDAGVLGIADDDLNILDRIVDKPPGATEDGESEGEDGGEGDGDAGEGPQRAEK